MDQPSIDSDFRFRFECTQCGKCCRAPNGHTVLTPADIRQIARFTRSTIEEFISSSCYLLERIVVSKNGEKLFSIWDLCLLRISGDCKFLDGKSCSIHDSKPLTCRAFPFIGSIEHIKYCIQSNDYCEGFGIGAEYNEKYIEEKLERYKNEYNEGARELIESGMDIRKLFHIRCDSQFSECVIEDEIFTY